MAILGGHSVDDPEPKYGLVALGSVHPSRIIRNIGARTENGQANVDIVIEIEDLKHLENIIQGVRKIPGVHDVQRLQRV